MRALPRRSGRPVRPENLHITLAFVGPVDERVRSCLEQRAAEVAVPPFTLNLSRAGLFERAGALWVGPEQTPPVLGDLVEHLNEALRPCGYEPDRRVFRPHMTLYRKARARPGPTDWDPLEWPVGGFALVESFTDPEGVRYQVLRRFGGQPSGLNPGA